MRLKQRQLEDSLQLLPNRERFRRVQTKGGKEGSFGTNSFKVLNLENQWVQLYKVAAFPSIGSDAKTWGRVIKKAEKQLTKEIGFIISRNDTIWGDGAKRSDTFSVEVEMKESWENHKPNEPSIYTLKITPTKTVSLNDTDKEDRMPVKDLIVRMIKNRIKEHLQLNYSSLGKDPFFVIKKG